MKKASKKATAAALVGVLALGTAGSLAFFTDRASGTATATAGTLDLELTQTWVADNDHYDLAAKGAGQDGRIDAMLPGYIMDMDYTLNNAGNKSMDVRETFVITCEEKTFNTTAPEFLIYNADDVELDAATGAYKVKDGAVAIPYTAEANKITVKPVQFVLNGSGGPEAEIEAEANGKSQYTGNYVMLFKADAENSWVGEKLTVSYLAEAKQHRNTGGIDSGVWTEMATETLTLVDDATLSVVPKLN